MINSSGAKFFIDDGDESAAENAMETINTMLRGVEFSLIGLKSDCHWLKKLSSGFEGFESGKITPAQWREPLKNKQATLNGLKKAASAIPWGDEFDELNLLDFGTNFKKRNRANDFVAKKSCADASRLWIQADW